MVKDFMTTMLSIVEQLEKIPIQNFYWCDRYDTDTEFVLHLWDSDGNSYDVRIPKRTV